MDINFQLDHKLKTAKDYESQGKLLHALQLYTQILDKNPDFEEVYFNLAELYEKLGKPDKSIELLNSFLERDSDSTEIRLFLGQFLMRHSMWEDTVEVLSLILPEEEPMASFFLGYAHFMLDEYEFARISFLNFVSFKEQNEFLYEAYIFLSRIEIKLNSYQSALLYAKKAEVFYANYWELNAIFAEIYLHLDMLAHAITPAEKALKLNPNESSVHKIAGKIYFKMGNYLKAEKHFRKYIEMDDEANSEAYLNLADACMKSKKTKDALNYYEVALKLDPENKLAIEGKNKASSILKK